MKRLLQCLAIAATVSILAACATVAGTAIGAGIGNISGNTEAGALIGGGIGMLVDIF